MRPGRPYLPMLTLIGLASLVATFGGVTPAQINGTWTLTLRDAASADTGSVSSAYLSFITPSGKGDFNDDGKSDILYRRVTNAAQNKVWLMNGVTRLRRARRKRQREREPRPPPTSR